jgi:putative transposase
MTARLVLISLRQVLRLLLLSCRSSRSKDLELLVLRQELAVLRRQVPHPKTRREERLVLTVLQYLRPARERLSNLFTPDTLRRWHRELVRRKWDRPHRIKPKRAIQLQTQLLVWRLAKEKPTWGYRRIQGELQKLGIVISATSIRRITAPKRRPGPKRDTWRQFMRTQASSIIACDLFTVESIGLKTLHVLFFIELHTRRVLIGGVTDGPANLAWTRTIRILDRPPEQELF